jgi:phage shock protein B
MHGLVAIVALFIGLPWIVLHYVTQWKRGGSLSVEDENLLDELHDLARRLDERMTTIERIVAADNPGWRPGLPTPAERLGDYDDERRRDH